MYEQPITASLGTSWCLSTLQTHPVRQTDSQNNYLNLKTIY
jgi:hypothetical protein